MEDLGGPLEDGVEAAIIGFDMGGPPAIQFAADDSFAYTCELSVRDDQMPCAQGQHWEIGVMDPKDRTFARTILRQMGSHFMVNQIAHDARVSVDGNEKTGPVSGTLLRLNLGMEDYAMYFLKMDDEPANTGAKVQ